MKHEWRKKEKEIYLPKNKPEIINVPEFKFLTIEGEGNPNDEFFSEYITVLYSLSYPIKMTLKKRQTKPRGYRDYTVYPLEGIWDINEEAKKKFDGKLNKNDLVFKLMIRQPDFIDYNFYNEILELTKKKKQKKLLDKVKFETIEEGKCVQMLHIGSYDDEPETFEIMESFTKENNLTRLSKVHKEIYLSDFRKVAPEKLKTVLRFKVK
ncbi:GyrI-like domain-containing protein [Aureibaculum sp. 2210JD6-5]|uniref:GyrI-like domain-containing protein n=1 Tax=Aureibaculum sp. 2210JD6-5 TaxID=3103957 RepID=UPI002AAED935|nr:GyrI-like domain-containing protein [Aureibaculum sp. 2210JD6-5]MDY7395335.1 GyrI-like domain-containing protein [Aureibaculum sp. 2210JD6-5]